MFEEAPQEFLSVDRGESLALHERSQTEMKNKDAEEWPCNGPGCNTYVRHKWEWQKQKDMKLGKTYY